MNDRQRLEAIVSVVCKYLPPDGISREQAMSEIIGLVDPLPEQEQRCEYCDGTGDVHDQTGEWRGVCVCEAGKALSKQEQVKPVAIIHRNEYNEYRLEPHDKFDIKSIPFNVDVPLYTTPQPKQEQVEPVAWGDVKVRPDGKRYCRAVATTNQSNLGYSPLYTTPPQRKPLTVQEIAEFVGTHEYGSEQLKWFRLGEAAHGIKE